ncbi:hypothetical protein DFH06DRAFT_1159150 [Mycena polygramma]|nr:hypothetical protein DFH06DRAFT_1159150 [Mycena polygramma]
MLGAAANATSHASTSALTVAARESAPTAASPFAQLLRNSRFATFDPLIRKTYYSPQQFVERGYWGLKRPITQRKKNSFVTIKEWETRQHYVEWDNAEDQVRFMRRMRELDLRPATDMRSKWSKQLGPARETWLVDSEFCPKDWQDGKKDDKADAKADAKADEQGDEQGDEPGESPKPDVAEPPPSRIAINALGRGGKGAYSSSRQRTEPTPVVAAERPKSQYGPRPSQAVIPNIEAMSPSEFKRYIAKLRSLRPAFLSFLKREDERQKQEEEDRKKKDAESTQAVGRSLETRLGGRSLLELSALRDSQPVHRRFLAQHTESEYKSTSSNKIQPQMHRNGALMYAFPSNLDTLFRTKPKPGIVLDWNIDDSARFQLEGNQAYTYITAFAGVTAVLKAKDAEGRLPLMANGVDRERWLDAVGELRPVTKDALSLMGVPRVVGRDPDEGLSGVQITLDVTAKRGFDDPQRKNPHIPGSREYVALLPSDSAREGTARAAVRSTAVPLTSLKNPPKRVDFQLTTQSAQERETSALTLNVLRGLLKTEAQAGAKPDDTVPDDEL